MQNERFIGMITSVSAALKSVKLPDGTKIKQGIFKVKLESADIDYKSIADFNSNISATLLNIQPIPFKSITFGEQLVNNASIELFCEEQDDTSEMEVSAVYTGLTIPNLSVVVKENIPVYSFFFEIPMECSGKFLFKNLKKKISFILDTNTLKV